MEEMTLRRTARDVCADLPAVRREIRWCDLAAREAAKINAIMRSLGGGEEELMRKLEKAVDFHEQGQSQGHLVQLRDRLASGEVAEYSGSCRRV